MTKKTFLTEYTGQDERLKATHIEGDDWKHAELIAHHDDRAPVIVGRDSSPA